MERRRVLLVSSPCGSGFTRQAKTYVVTVTW